MKELRLPQSDDFQECVLRAYTALRLLRADWGGALIVCGGLGAQGAALAMGANIAGAVCLSIEEKPELLKGALRSGACDFIVNTLDEALRAMKNEVRKHQPVSVGLEGNPSDVLLECLERGVQSELIVDFSETHFDCSSEEMVSYGASIEQLRRQGATLMSFDESALDEGDLGRFMRERQWELQLFRVDDAVRLRAFDARALGLLADEDMLRRHWLQSVSRIVQRQRPLRRALWVTAMERQMLEDGGRN